MTTALALYILALETGAASTHEAADRPVYRALLAGAAPLLARAALGADAATLAADLRAHERQRGHTWLTGDERAASERAWAAVVGA